MQSHFVPSSQKKILCFGLSSPFCLNFFYNSSLRNFKPLMKFFFSFPQFSYSVINVSAIFFSKHVLFRLCLSSIALKYSSHESFASKLYISYLQVITNHFLSKIFSFQFIQAIFCCYSQNYALRFCRCGIISFIVLNH